jgi:hypothetical protein
MIRFLDALFCLFGAHAWLYGAEVDAQQRPLFRRCKCCSTHEIREYSSYDSGTWVSLHER